MEYVSIVRPYSLLPTPYSLKKEATMPKTILLIGTFDT